MGEVSSIAEVLETAIARETRAAQFYAEVAERTGNPTMRILFERLAEEELRHKARLELEMMKEGVVARTVGIMADVGEPEYAAELEIGPNIEYRQALEIAVRKERSSFRFYTQLAGILLDDEVHDVILELAEEEARHLVQFETEYKKLTRGEA